MSWDDHDGERRIYRAPGFDLASILVLDEPCSQVVYDECLARISPLRALAGDYQRAAGEAYAQGQDQVAAKMRDAATELRALADRLPEIPPVTRD
ncbi:MAG: hypothetical protein Q8P18_18285 [Pseudomonadota bacterium]|nr:hypothetical protein [Pseudomonadota bacterium]